ncbi:MAG TPA: hypothetical protein VGM54_09835 [Chthoniobacter sp.]|jgi:hypothetical protein
MATTAELKEKLNARLGQIEKFKTYKPEKVEKEIKDLDEEIREKETERAEKKAELATFYSFIGEPVPIDSSVIPGEELKEKIKAVMPRFPNGTNGKELAAAIADHRVTSESISSLYWTDGQVFLKKGKNSKGEVEMGSKTRYLLATADDKESILADKKFEEEREEKAKAKRKKAQVI